MEGTIPFYFWVSLPRSTVPHVARWSRGMIRASGARGPGFKSRTSPMIFLNLLLQIKSDLTAVQTFASKVEAILKEENESIYFISKRFFYE